MNEVSALIGKQLDFESKLRAKSLGPARPDMDIQQVTLGKIRNFTRKFSRSLYDKAAWLCGCNERNAFFCFPCLLFKGDDAWSTVGVRDLKHLNDKIKKHGISKRHLNNEMDVALLGQVDIRMQLDDAYRLSIRKHNEQVDKNRYIISRLIDCIKFCGAFELALRGHDESAESDNPGIFRGLVDFIATLGNAMKEHLETAGVGQFKGTSKTIQNELLDAMLTICREYIAQEITSANSLAIQADETTDCATKMQMVLLFRYHINGNIHERFWGYFQPPSHTAEGISSVILEELSKLGVNKSPDKLVGQTFDGAAVMGGRFNGVQARIKEHYKDANFVHCYAHQGNLIMQKATSDITQAKIFFSNLQGLSSFFSRSSKRTEVLDAIVKKRLPKAPSTRWNFQSRIVNTVYENKDALTECFEIICESEKDHNTVLQASGFLRLLNDNEFAYWLEFFHKIMPHVDILFAQIQKRSIDSVQVSGFVSEFVNHIQKVRTQVADADYNTEDDEVPAKRRRMERNKKHSALEICDIIIAQVKDRFHYAGHLSAAKLFSVENFEAFSKEFPENCFNTTVNTYSNLNRAHLRTELEVLYSRNDLRRATGAASLLQLFLKNNMQDTFSECVQLLGLIVTLPMTTVESERCFSTLACVKTFLRNSMCEDRLNALAMLSIERKMVHSIPNFNDRVIEGFSRMKDRKMEFLYKN